MRLGPQSLSAKILKTLSVFTGVQVITIVCSIIRTKFIALWIGEIGVGLFAIFNSVIDLVSSSTQLNLRDSAVRDISAASPKRLPFIATVVRWWALRLGLLGAVVMIIFSPLLSVLSFGSMSYWWAFMLLSVSIFAISYSNGEYAIMQGGKMLNILAKSSAIAALISTLLSLPLYYCLGVASIVPSLLIFGVIGAFVVSIYKRTISVSVSVPECVREGKGFIRLGLYLTVSMCVTSLASYIFLSYLNRYASTEDVGLYQAGYTLIIRYVGIVFSALAMEFYPRLVNVANRPKMTSIVVSHEIILIMYVITPLLVIFVAFDEIIVDMLYAKSFCEMLPFVTIGIGTTIFRVISYCMAYVVISRGDGKLYVVTEILSSVIGLSLNIYMFKNWSYVGLGVSYVLWYIIYTIIVGIVYYRYGMRIMSSVVKLSVCTITLVGSAIIAKPLGINATLPIIIISMILSVYGYKKILSKNRKL